MKMEKKLCMTCADLMEDGFKVKPLNNISGFKCESCKKQVSIGKVYEISSKRSSK